jgi:hypothetical protein
MGIRKKSSDINRNYPVLGYRIAKADRETFLSEFEAVLELLSHQPEYRRLNLKKNAVFLRALELGLEQIKKRKTLG